MPIPPLDSRGARGGEGPTDARIYAGATGTVKAVMLFVDFPDAPGTASPAAVADHLLGGDGARRLFFDQSYGRLDLSVSVRADLGWRRMPKEAESYNFWRPTMEVDGHRAYIAAAAALFKDEVSFRDFHFVYVVGPEGAPLPLSPAFTVFPTQGARVSRGREITLAVTFGRDSYANSFIVGVHEVGHLFGLPDLYPAGGFAEDSAAGCWCIMSDIFRASGFLGWHRHKAGWLDEARTQYVAQTGTTRAMLTPLHESAGVSMLVFPAERRPRPSKVWVIEVAQPVFAKGTNETSGIEGVLFYTVDATRDTGKSPVAVIPRTVSRNSTFGNLFEAPFQPGDTVSDSSEDAVIELTVLGRTGTAYDVEVAFSAG